MMEVCKMQAMDGGPGQSDATMQAFDKEQTFHY